MGTRLLGYVEERARRLGAPEVRLYTNEAMTENLTYYPRRGYTETHRAEQDGYRRVFFRKSLSTVDSSAPYARDTSTSQDTSDS